VRDRQTVLIKRNHIAIAQITPPQRSMPVAQALTLVRPGLTEAEGRRWLKESQGNFEDGLIGLTMWVLSAMMVRYALNEL